MSMWSQEISGREGLNVVQFEERTIDQMMDERRLILTLNSKGLVQDATGSPESLFGFVPDALVGSHLMYVLDIFRPGLDSRHDLGPTQLLDLEDQATRVLFNMAER